MLLEAINTKTLNLITTDIIDTFFLKVKNFEIVQSTYTPIGTVIDCVFVIQVFVFVRKLNFK